MMSPIDLYEHKQKLGSLNHYILNIMKPLAMVLVVLLFLFSNTNTYASTVGRSSLECAGDANTPNLIDEQIRAEVAVTKRPEYISLNSTLEKNKRLLIESSLVHETVIGKCAWQISVFIDDKTEFRRILWQMYLVNRLGHVEYFLNDEGQFVRVQDQK